MPAALIACVYCGESHTRVSDVRACWERAQGSQLELEIEVPQEPPEAPTPVTTSGFTAEAERLAGPPQLGRNLVVSAEQADIPDPWRACEVVTVNGAPGDQLLDRLLELAFARTPVVLRLTGDFPGGAAPAEVEPRPPWQITPAFRFPTEALRHLVWSNAVDAREPGRARFGPVDLAVALGARPGGPADVLLPDGTPLFCDGGPIAFTTGADLGVPEAAVIHRIALEHGSLDPFAGNANTAELAPDQLAAVVHAGGGARIIAPAGSGKTRVLTERARHLIRNWRIPGRAVCLVAFNVRAAAEMRDRTADLPDLQVRTLNSLALAVLNGTAPFRARGQRVQTIDESDVRTLLDDIVDLPRRANTDPAAAWIEALSLVRLGLRDPDDVEDEYGGDVDGLGAAFDDYRGRLAGDRLVDFDEQIYGAIEALLREPGARAAAQRACRLLLVDEFQDLHPAHMLMLRLIAGPGGAVFGVGDDDQTIYGYAGASPEWLIRFSDYFPGAGEHALEINYRCPPSVVAAADRLLQRNRRRIAKSIRPAPAKSGMGPEGLRVLGADTVDPETGEITASTEADDLTTATTATAGHVGRLVAGGVPPDDIAVLTRVNASLAPVQVALAHSGVPVRTVVDESWLARSGVRAALAWLRLATRTDRLAGPDIQLAARRPPRALSPKAVEWMSEQRSVDRLHALAGRLSGRDTTKVAGFADDVDRLASLVRSGAQAAAVLAAVRDDIGLDGAMQTLEGSRRRLDRSAQTDDLDALFALATLHPEAATFESWLREELRRPRRTEGVTLATVHSVKGREWPHVVVHDASAGLMPHRLALDVEEERRVFHVAITRGVETVAIAAGDPPSPFIAELFRPPADDRGEVVTARAAPPPAESPRRRDARSPAVPRQVADPEAFERADRLIREWRRARAATEGKPAFTILHDTTVADIAAALPASLTQLSAIKGIGPSKLDRFGDELLAVIEEARNPAGT